MLGPNKYEETIIELKEKIEQTLPSNFNVTLEKPDSYGAMTIHITHCEESEIPDYFAACVFKPGTGISIWYSEDGSEPPEDIPIRPPYGLSHEEVLEALVVRSRPIRVP